ncbi:MAG: tellurite resistance TerB family protein [Gammaproteobacteria bacterium]|nr:tellurite resistance TerB family protein [Gammaproteobacteria bacterium]
MVDVNKLLGQFMGSGFAGGMAGGLASSLLTTKSGRKMGKSALKMGGVAAVGALAYTAYQRFSNAQNTTTTKQTVQGEDSIMSKVSLAPPGSVFLPNENDQKAYDSLGLTLVRAMIAVARSDGRLDAQESQLIFQKINSLGLDSESQNLLIKEMGHPVDVDAIVNSATSPEIAAEIYIASLLAIDVDNTSEKAYLAMLAARLQLPPELVTELEAQVNAQKTFA